MLVCLLACQLAAADHERTSPGAAPKTYKQLLQITNGEKGVGSVHYRGMLTEGVGVGQEELGGGDERHGENKGKPMPKLYHAWIFSVRCFKGSIKDPTGFPLGVPAGPCSVSTRRSAFVTTLRRCHKGQGASRHIPMPDGSVQFTSPLLRP